MGFREKTIERAQDWVQGRLPQSADRAVVAKILCGHLRRLRDRPAELEASLAHPDPAPIAAANLINRVRREVEALAAQLSADADVEVPTDLFDRLIDAVVLAVDSQDERVRKSGRELFNAVVRDLPLMLAAEDEAKSAHDAYARGNDLPRLLVGAVARLRKDLDAMARELIPKVVGKPTIAGTRPHPWPLGDTWHPISWFLLQRQDVHQLALAAADLGNKIGLEVWEKQFQRAKPFGALPGRPERIHLWVNPAAGMLGVEVYASAEAPKEPSRGLDGWSVRVSVGSDVATQPEMIRDGKAMINIGLSIEPEASVQFADPETQIWVDCLFDEKNHETR